jgi:nitroimidazol reductase NimA-like FMN-containing flavoprotein (pyridoxamine 5'-phosphate oxidase superfamily)
VRRKDREVTDINEVISIIERCKVCHLGMADKGMPYVVPLNHGYSVDGETLTLYFHCAWEGRKIDILKENNAVCFEMANEGELALSENPCNTGYYFESVIGFGHAEFVEDIDEKCRALSLIMKHQANQDVVFNEKQANSVCVFKVVSSDFTGKRKPGPGATAK